MPRTESSSAVPQGYLDFIICPRLYPFSARTLGPNVKVGQGHKLLGPTIAPQNLAAPPLGRRGGFC